MTTLRWTSEENSLLESLLEKTQSVEYIENQLKEKYTSSQVGFEHLRTGEAISRRIRRLKEANPDSLSNSMDERWKRLLATSSQYKTEEEPSYLPVSSKVRMILSLSDLHLPFTPLDRVKEILDKHKDELNKVKSTIVLNGDIMDQYAASSFGKYRKVALADEYNMALDLVDLCLDYTEHVFLTRGNHEKRLGRLIRENIDDDVSSIFSSDLLARIQRGEEIDRYGLSCGFRARFKDRVHYQLKEPWYVRIGKTIFAHPSEFKSGPGGTAVAVAEYLSGRYSRSDYDAVVLAHTHLLYKGVVSNRLLIEQGSMCGRLDYEYHDNLKFKHSQNGYAIIYQDEEGNTNFNDSNFIYLGSMLPKKKKTVF